MKKGNTVSSRRTAGLFLVVAGFLGLLLVNNGAFAQTYTEVFSDDFNRTYAQGNAIGNGRTFPGGQNCDNIRPNPAVGVNNWSVTNNLLKGGANSCDDRSNGGSQYAWRSSPMLQADYSVFNGKVVFDYDTTIAPVYSMMGILARYDPATGKGLYFGIYEAPDGTSNQLYARKLFIGNYGDPNRDIGSIQGDRSAFSSAALPEQMRVELILQNENWTFNVYDLNGDLSTPILIASGTDNDIVGYTGGVWGLQSFNANAPADNFVLYRRETPLIISADKKRIRTNEQLTYTIIDDENRTITLNDNGVGGTFSPASLTLDSGNKYAGTIIYTPPTDYVGTITISDGADFSGQVVIQPYAMTIALLGDSISNNMGTTYVKTALGNEFSILNVAVCGGTSSEYANDYIGTAKCGGFASQGEQVMTKALNAFSSNGVELVHIMIGTNDLGKETEQYKTNMQMIIDTLRDNPITQSQIKHVIISKLIWRDTSKVGGDLVKMAAFNEVIDELIAENGGFVLIGDEDAYAWFEVDNDTNMSDGLHPNGGTGRTVLAEFWATAIKSALQYQINPNTSFLSGNAHTLGTTGSLTFRVDKYFGEFNDVVKVDGMVVPTTGYVATSGSTTIELNADYLNTLTAGEHTLTVGFKGGVEVAGDFTILPETTVPPVTPPNVSVTPSYGGGGGGGISLVKDSCPSGDFSPSYYDNTCGTTAELTNLVAEKVSLLKSLIQLIFIKATAEEKTLVHKIITSCSETNNNEIIRLACQELVKDWDF